MNVEMVVLNCHVCNQCLSGHKSLGLLFEVFSKCNCHFKNQCINVLSFCWSCHLTSSLWSNVPNPEGRYLRVLSKCLRLCLFVGQVSSSTVSMVTSLGDCSLVVFFFSKVWTGVVSESVSDKATYRGDS